MASKKRPSVKDWEDLRFFLEARRMKSLSGASRKLGVDHTTVSRRIAALEGALGVRLFDRTPRGYEPTRAADDLLPLAERVEEQVAALERRAEPSSEHTGVVRIAATHSIATELVIPALPELRERHPGIVVEVSADNRGASLSRREADVALRLGRPKEIGFVTRKLGELGHAFYVRRAGRRDLSLDLHKDTFVGYDDSLAHISDEKFLSRIAPNRRVVFRANSLQCLVAAVRMGLGAGLLPCFVGDADPALLRVATEVSPPPRELWLVVHGELRRSARIRVVIDCLIERAGAMRDRLAG